MKAMTSIEREAQKQLTVAESYQHPPAIVNHVYMITHSRKEDLVGVKYYAVMDSASGAVRLYCLDNGIVWRSASTFGYSMDRWEDITDKVYLNIDELINKVCLNTDKLEAQQ